MNNLTRNRWTYGLGAIGRDNVYVLVTTYLIYYLTDVIKVSTFSLWWITAAIMVIRILDIPRDPVLGMIVDNTNSKWGKFKPWIAAGTAATMVFTLLLFTDFKLPQTMFIVVFIVIYLLWDVSFSFNDVAYLSMMTTLSMDQKEREKISSAQRTSSYFGTYLTMACILPVTAFFTGITQNPQQAWLIFAVLASAAMFLCQCLTVFGVKETGFVKKHHGKTPLRELFLVIIRNDQLVCIVLAILFFNIGNTMAAGLGIYYFKYVIMNENIYPFFSIIVGISQIAAMFMLPVIRRRMSRLMLFRVSMVLSSLGYILLFFVRSDFIPVICICGIFIFVGNANLLMISWVFLVDAIDYGHWKLGKRNDSVNVSVTSFANKMGSAVSNAFIGIVIVVSNIKGLNSGEHLAETDIIIVKSAMTFVPFLFLVTGYIIYSYKYHIDEKMHIRILAELRAKGEIENI